MFFGDLNVLGRAAGFLARNSAMAAASASACSTLAFMRSNLAKALSSTSETTPAAWVSIFLRKSAARFRAESVARFRLAFRQFGLHAGQLTAETGAGLLGGPN